MGIAFIIPGVSFASSNFGKVTPLRVPISGLEISGATEVSNRSQYHVVYSPENTTELGVVWEITNGNEYATINSTGMLTATSLADSSSVTIKATSTHNSGVFATKTVLVSSVSEFALMPQNITLEFINYRPIMLNLKPDTETNGLERMLYATSGTVKLNTLPEGTYKGALQYITNDMYMIDIPEGATAINVSGSGVYLNNRNVRITTFQSNLATATRVEQTVSSIPSTVTFNSGARYLYVRITKASVENEYVVPKLTWIYE